MTVVYVAQALIKKEEAQQDSQESEKILGDNGLDSQGSDDVTNIATAVTEPSKAKDEQYSEISDNSNIEADPLQPKRAATEEKEGDKHGNNVGMLLLHDNTQPDPCQISPEKSKNKDIQGVNIIVTIRTKPVARSLDTEEL